MSEIPERDSLENDSSGKDSSEKVASGEVTRLLLEVSDGEEGAFDRLFPLVYNELRRLAGNLLRRELNQHTLFATGLVHEAYLKMVDRTRVEWQGRAHFFAVAARAMRQVLVDHARKKSAEKRGGDWQRTTLGDESLAADLSFEELLALDAALDRLNQLDERLRQVVELRFFGGLTEQEIAEVLEVAIRTVQRQWAKARAWLYAELYPDRS